MRKLLLMSFLMALFSGVFAQTQGSPMEIPIGEGKAYSYSETSYFTYTAPTNTNVFLKVVAVGGNNLSGYIDGNIVGSSSEYSGSNAIYTYAVGKGKKLDITASVWWGGPYSIYATVEETDADIDGGKTCDDAVVIDKEKTYVPSNYDYEKYYATSYATYQPTESGTVKILFINCQAPNTFSVANSCDQDFTSVTSVDDAVNGSYFKLDVEAEKTYIFKLEGWSSSPYYISIVPLETGPGTSCDDPFVPDTDGKLILPAEAGTYWFQYPLTLKDGFYIVSSEANLGDEGRAVVVDNCQSTWPSFESKGGIKLRKRIGNDYGSKPTTTLHFAVVKPTATTEAEVITVTESALEEGDAKSMPKTIVADTEYRTKEYSGYYYYEFTLPETVTESKYANIAVTDNTITGDINLQLIDKETRRTLADGPTSVKAPVEPGKTYLLNVNTYNDFSAPFMLTFTDILQGDEYVKAIQATAEGANNIRPGKTYYKYTATKSGYLKVDAGNSDIIPTFPVANGSYENHDRYPEGTGYKIEETEGVTYVFYFDGITEDNLTFTITELDVEAGQIEAKPIALNNGKAVDLSKNSNVTTFFSYTAADNALLELETDMPFYSYYDYNTGTSSYTQFGIKDGSWWSTVSGGNDGYQISRPVPAGSTTLLKVITAYDPSTTLENPYTVTATETKFADLPNIEIVVNEDGTTSENTFTAPMLTTYHVKWYYVNIPLKGTFKISSGGNSYAAFRMYSVDCVDNYDENRYVVRCYPQEDNYVWTSEFTYDAPSKGEYILCLYESPGYNGEGAEVTTSFTPDQIALSITSVDNSSNAKVTEVYDMSGRRVSNIGNHGIYIVKTSDGKVRKVAVK